MRARLFLAFASVVLIAALNPGPARGQSKTRHPNYQSAADQDPARQPKAIRGNFEHEAYEPEESDDIAHERQWMDKSGEHSTKAALVSAKPESVTLKKVDGANVTVPVKALCEKDQELIRDFRILASKRKVAAAVDEFYKTDFGDTDARVAENEKTAIEKLYRQINGRDVRLVFPIQNVQPFRDNKPGIYTLALDLPDFPTTDNAWTSLRSVNEKLSKEDSLKIGPSSVLVVDGKVTATFSSEVHFHYQADAGRVLRWLPQGRLPSGTWHTREITITLEGIKMRVQNRPADPKADKKDRADASTIVVEDAPTKAGEAPPKRGDAEAQGGDGALKEKPAVETAERRMTWTSERLDDDSLLVVIHGTPFGDVRGVCADGQTTHRFRILGENDKPMVVIARDDNSVRSVTWDGKEVPRSALKN